MDNGTPAKDKTSRVLASIALLVSIVLPITSFLCTRHDISEARKTKFTVTPKFALEKIYLGEFKEIQVIDLDYQNVEKFPPPHYLGFHIFIEVTVYNESQHALSVSEIKVVPQLNSGIYPELISKECFENDYISRTSFPKVLGPYEIMRTYVRVNLPLTRELKNKFNHLPRNQLYTSEEITKAYNKTSSVKIAATNISLKYLFIKELTKGISSNPDEPPIFRAVVKFGSGAWASARTGLK